MIIAQEDYILLNGKRVPGVFAGLEIRQEVRFKETDIPGQSGASKKPEGFSDAEVQITLRVSGGSMNDVWNQVQQINAMFSGTGKHAKPRIYRLTTPHSKARRIDRVLFKELTTREGNDSDTVHAVLSFIQHHSVQRKKEGKSPPVKLTDYDRYVQYSSESVDMDKMTEFAVTGQSVPPKRESPIKDTK